MGNGPVTHRFEAKAQGKLLLVGEHAAVYGHPALGIPLSCACTLVWEPKAPGNPRALGGARALTGTEALNKTEALKGTGTSNDQSTVNSVPLDLVYNGTSLSPDSKEYQLFAAILDQGWQGLKLSGNPSGLFTIHNGIPETGGFGSSAALSACLAQVLLTFSNSVPTNPNQRFIQTWQLANFMERIFHGNPSGIDTGLALSQGPCGFNVQASYQSNSKEDRPNFSTDTFSANSFTDPSGTRGMNTNHDFMAAPWPDSKNRLPAIIKFPQISLPLVYGAIPRQGSTKELVGAIWARHQAHDPETLEQIQQLGRISYAAIQLIEAYGKNHLAPSVSLIPTDQLTQDLGQLFDQSQAYLSLLGVSTPELEAILSLARDVGFVGAKLSGAGGGGAFILLAPQANLLDLLIQKLETQLAARGMELLVPLTKV